MALIATVVLTVLAGSIVLAIVAESTTATRAESNRHDAANATRIAADAQRAFEAALQVDPYYFDKTVFSQSESSGVVYAELARTCTNSSYTATVQPGDSWATALAAGCTTWTYGTAQDPSLWAGPAAGPGSAWLKVSPPTHSDPLLKVDIEATSGSASDGLSLTYKLSGSEQFTLWSSSNLVLDDASQGCTGGSVCSVLSGTTYSGGNITLPTSPAVDISSSELASEVGFTTTPTSTTTRYYSSTVSAGPPAVRQIRDVIPAYLSMSTLRASLTDPLTLACPGGTGPSAPTDPLASDGSSTSLCLAAGQHLRLTSSTTTTVPSDVDGYLIEFTGATTASGQPTVTVYYSTARIAPRGACATSCDLQSAGLADTTSSPLTAPGDISFWDGSVTNGNHLLGTFPYPSTGIVFADRNVYLGACSDSSSPTAYLTTGASCPALTSGASSTPGMVIPSSTTIVAGDATTPADVYLGTSITTAPKVSFGVVASGSLFFPYWARSPGTTSASTQTVDGAYTALAYGADTGSTPIVTFPRVVDATNPHNVGSSLTVNGSLVAPEIDMRLGLFTTVHVGYQSILTSQPPPYFSNFLETWAAIGTERLSAADACGATASTCLPSDLSAGG